MSAIHLPFSSQLITSNFSSVWNVIHRFFIWIALGVVDSHFSLILIRKANAIEEETRQAA
jgi:hypothetical protein